MTTTIRVGQSHIAFVDDSDVDRVRSFGWSAHHLDRKTGVYARSTVIIDGKRVRLLMHRIILNVRPGQFTDHIDGNGLNNQRSNLRVCSHAENMRNRRKLKQSGTSPYKGVYAYGSTGKFLAVIRDPASERQFPIGVFDEAREAAIAYDAEARRLFGEFARPNFPEVVQ